MALKDILVRLDHTETGFARLDLSAELARRHGARLTGLYVRDQSMAHEASIQAGELGLASAAAISEVNQRIDQALLDEMLKTQERFERSLREKDIQGEWRCHNGPARDAMSSMARYKDLCIVGSNPLDDERFPLVRESAEQVIFLSGRPVLIVPPDTYSSKIGTRIVIGWDASRAATRSVNDALPLIVKAEQTEVVAVNPKTREGDRNEELPGTEIAEHLARHGAKVSVTCLHEKGDAGDILLRHARECGADLLVTGCYGHSRIAEFLLGGTTLSLLNQTGMPVLMSY
ncbi:universal stress protein [Methyloferula stellata]|uniref:universal stress protein n=1 Tax=Methyloferula stellata TaxID=876270 RepID=UPI000375A234|nr:universal stress protein [Methyloferula stellata]